MSFETSIHLHVRAEAIEPTISQRMLRLGRAPHRWFHHALLVQAGRVDVVRTDATQSVQGPALLLFAPSEGESLVFSAGAHGCLLGLSPEIFAEALGDHAESPSLRLFASAHVTAEHLSASARQELLLLFHGAISETHDEGRASRMAISAYGRLIYMSAWRMFAPVEQAGPQRGGHSQILQRFRQLVETHFRQHWPVARYARELGVSTDRLHAICSRSLGRSPLALVHDRLAQEARLRLERSGHGVQEISDSLGFRDPANFSHFFKRRTGLSPAKYRAESANSSGERSIPVSADYADWP